MHFVTGQNLFKYKMFRMRLSHACVVTAVKVILQVHVLTNIKADFDDKLGNFWKHSLGPRI